MLKSNPDDPDGLHLLGAIALRRHEPKRGGKLLQRAISLKPDDPDINFHFGLALRDVGHHKEAITAFRRAIKLNPKHMRARRNLGHLLVRYSQVEEGQKVLEEAVAVCPDDSQSYHFLGNVYRTQSRTSDAVASYRKAIALDPELTMARLGLCTANLPVIYETEDQLEASRADYEQSLHELRDFYDGKPQDALAHAAKAVGAVQPFFLAYQGRNDRSLQLLYGELMCRFMAAAFPRWSEPPRMPTPEADGRIRVGILSGFYRAHSNWKIPIRGWAEQLDRSKFRLFGYYTQSERDANTQQAAKSFERFEIGPKSIKQWGEIIRGDDLHVLITPEVGMDPTTAQLAGLRLAPVQCGSWGHPETSGFHTMDYFLSSDLMEPEDGQEHYSETLVRLPNLSIHYSLPELANDELGRSELGLRPDSVAYWCCQALVKYLPRHDDLFPRIAAEVGDCQFVFIRHKSDLATRKFQDRLARAFREHGLDSERHCVFIKRLPLERFAAAMRSVDLFLDSLGWSGCNTTMEAIGVGLPVITCPGDLMRGRHTSAILQMLDLQEAIAATKDEYVELAIALGRDAARRAELARLTAERHGRASHDLECVRGLESFLQEVAGVD